MSNGGIGLGDILLGVAAGTARGGAGGLARGQAAETSALTTALGSLTREREREEAAELRREDIASRERAAGGRARAGRAKAALKGLGRLTGDIEEEIENIRTILPSDSAINSTLEETRKEELQTQRSEGIKQINTLSKLRSRAGRYVGIVQGRDQETQLDVSNRINDFFLGGTVDVKTEIKVVGGERIQVPVRDKDGNIEFTEDTQRRIDRAIKGAVDPALVEQGLRIAGDFAGNRGVLQPPAPGVAPAGRRALEAPQIAGLAGKSRAERITFARGLAKKDFKGDPGGLFNDNRFLNAISGQVDDDFPEDSRGVVSVNQKTGIRVSSQAEDRAKVANRNIEKIAVEALLAIGVDPKSVTSRDFIENLENTEVQPRLDLILRRDSPEARATRGVPGLEEEFTGEEPLPVPGIEPGAALPAPQPGLPELPGALPAPGVPAQAGLPALPGGPEALQPPGVPPPVLPGTEELPPLPGPVTRRAPGTETRDIVLATNPNAAIVAQSLLTPDEPATREEMDLLSDLVDGVFSAQDLSDILRT